MTLPDQHHTETLREKVARLEKENALLREASGEMLLFLVWHTCYDRWRAVVEGKRS